MYIMDLGLKMWKATAIRIWYVTSLCNNAKRISTA